ncbi:prenyltransferase/squalene oxidase repeat-containing protein [Streptomyces sp. Ncost-T10-10d]|uniref:prenyltransferase/squalene oxidase repeat-containing protein n=1 Tax=Streptomyces sp. Ncost-T10-10d TaxID=1839774 RepID=UPI00081DEE99|nr:prenyltransferase/squalene oxidase repeat-containing protein [Streptomyces sp. Ncost-T10-10d]SCF65539.1 Prenyltransferase and squalene oxidase repeat-containing protein [Streptomyces sp. Ncost-T10-10d]
MSISTPVATPYAERATSLVARADQDRWGSVGPSLYESARVLSAAPWLPGEPRRITYLLEQQAPDGSWGQGPLPYRLLPTLSAVEAALAVLQRGTTSPEVTGRLTAAVNTGLGVLRALPPCPWPDTAAAEILVPSLVAKINERLGSLTTNENTPEPGSPQLPVPGGFHAWAPARVARRYEPAGSLPVKFHHTFEGIDSYIPPSLVPDTEGLLGSSPAATAARATRSPATTAQAITDLTAVAQRYGGLFPEAAPLRVVERLWIAAALARTHLPAAALPTLRRWAEDIYDPQGVRGAPGLMTDADDTAMAVLVASLVGLPYDPAPLDLFHNGSHYDCYIGEDTGSVTANAHALQALVSYLRRDPTAEHTYGPRAAKLCDWLTGQQQPEGHWTDKWHASPYYATARSVTALAQYGGHDASGAVRSAAAWTTETQRSDGSWGVWGSTVEETAYAVKILLSAATSVPQPQHIRALDLAETYLHTASHPGHQHPALWHDKTLYAPTAVIEAEVLSARELLRARRAAACTEADVERRDA